MNQLLNYNPVLLALLATLFTWFVTAAGSSMVFFFKAINKKIDSLSQVKIQDRIRNLEFVGNKFIQGNFFALFRDPRTGRLNLCDGQNNWFTYDQGLNQLLPKR